MPGDNFLNGKFGQTYFLLRCYFNKGRPYSKITLHSFRAGIIKENLTILIILIITQNPVNYTPFAVFILIWP